MDKTLLEQWLCGAESIPPAPFTVACALGLPVDEVADTTLLRTVPRVRSLRFVLAVLQDLFPEDIDVQIWLDAPRPELRGRSAREALLAGQTEPVEQLAVAAWNDRGDQAFGRARYTKTERECGEGFGFQSSVLGRAVFSRLGSVGSRHSALERINVIA